MPAYRSMSGIFEGPWDDLTEAKKRGCTEVIFHFETEDHWNAVCRAGTEVDAHNGTAQASV